MDPTATPPPPAIAPTPRPSILVGLNLADPPAVVNAIVHAFAHGATIADVEERLPPCALEVSGSPRDLSWGTATAMGVEYWKYYFARMEWGVGYAGAVVRTTAEQRVALIPPREYVGSGRLQVLSGIAEVYDEMGQIVAVLAHSAPAYVFAPGATGFTRFTGLIISLAQGGIRPVELAPGIFPPSGWDGDNWADLPPRPAPQP